MMHWFLKRSDGNEVDCIDELVEMANDAGGKETSPVTIGKNLLVPGAGCEEGELADTDEFETV